MNKTIFILLEIVPYEGGSYLGTFYTVWEAEDFLEKLLGKEVRPSFYYFREDNEFRFHNGSTRYTLIQETVYCG